VTWQTRELGTTSKAASGSALGTTSTPDTERELGTTSTPDTGRGAGTVRWQCHKTFYSRNLIIFVLSYCVCLCEAFPVKSNVCDKSQRWST